tara:strand:- start:150 stop:1016 length:867 start_codon:yes stop_codon:yes gene_type:complete
MGSNDEKMERREKMKVALCLHGLVGSPSAKSYDAETPLDGKKICAELAFKDWKKYIIDENDIDVFFHTWDLDLEDYLVESYQPKKYQIEKQIIFKPEYKEDNKRNQAVYSRFHSAQRAGKLKKEYEIENNFIYDCVIDARFDLAWNKPVKFSDYNMSYFYIPVVVKDGKWYGYPLGPGSDEGHQPEVEDLMFYSNSEYMDVFFNLNDKMAHYNKTIYQWKGMSSHFSIYSHLKESGLLPYTAPGLKICSAHSTEWLDDDYFNVLRRAYFKENLRPGKQGEVLAKKYEK